MSCKKIRIKKRRYCAADLNKKITLQNRTIATPADVDFDETFEKHLTVWAGIKTLTGVEIFDHNNVLQKATHDFIIHYRDWVTAQNWILYKGSRYDILDVNNLEERNEWLVLRSALKGSDTMESTKS